MELIYDFFTGHPNQVVSSLNRSIGQYLANYDDVKIGITANPERRFQEHAVYGWDNMIVKYKTESVKYVNTIEEVLIEKYFDHLTNEVGGGGGRNAEDGPYYLYVLVRNY